MQSRSGMEPKTKACRQRTVAELHRRVAEARARLRRTVARTEDELATLEVPQAGALTEDAGRDTMAASMERLEGREKHELDEIDAAQARLAAGGFGVCERCGRAIPVARLRAIPFTRYCLACQAGEER
jgi:DnaK suppressor protein